MKQLLDHRYILPSLLGLAVVLGVLLYFLPSEKTLDRIIRIIFLHGALVQVGLLMFSAAGVLGLIYLLNKEESLYQWGLAAQKTAVIVWIMYTFSSVVVTYLAWGVAIAWNEPRVQVSANILGGCVVFLVLTLLMKHRQFTAVVNVVLAVLVWFLIKRANIVRHPFNPIGSSDSTNFKWFFIAICLTILFMVIQLTRWIHRPSEVKSE